jgi:hypothetical protein
MLDRRVALPTREDKLGVYDMVRHSESYIPEIAVLNPQIDALETILADSF